MQVQAIMPGLLKSREAIVLRSSVVLIFMDYSMILKARHNPEPRSEV